ncbi:hypothetical protein Pelo_12516 [Pelomyxa schiedti]|nr:hypothetical protein Pelo_12516 [Pelomyxa schiedti]
MQPHRTHTGQQHHKRCRHAEQHAPASRLGSEDPTTQHYHNQQTPFIAASPSAAATGLGSTTSTAAAATTTSSSSASAAAAAARAPACTPPDSPHRGGHQHDQRHLDLHFHRRHHHHDHRHRSGGGGSHLVGCGWHHHSHHPGAPPRPGGGLHLSVHQQQLLRDGAATTTTTNTTTSSIGNSSSGIRRSGDGGGGGGGGAGGGHVHVHRGAGRDCYVHRSGHPGGGGGGSKSDSTASAASCSRIAKCGCPNCTSNGNRNSDDGSSQPYERGLPVLIESNGSLLQQEQRQQQQWKLAQSKQVEENKRHCHHHRHYRVYHRNCHKNLLPLVGNHHASGNLHIEEAALPTNPTNESDVNPSRGVISLLAPSRTVEPNLGSAAANPQPLPVTIEPSDFLQKGIEIFPFFTKEQFLEMYTKHGNNFDVCLNKILDEVPVLNDRTSPTTEAQNTPSSAASTLDHGAISNAQVTKPDLDACYEEFSHQDTENLNTETPIVDERPESEMERGEGATIGGEDDTLFNEAVVTDVKMTLPNSPQEQLPSQQEASTLSSPKWAPIASTISNVLPASCSNFFSNSFAFAASFTVNSSITSLSPTAFISVHIVSHSKSFLDALATGNSPNGTVAPTPTFAASLPTSPVYQPVILLSTTTQCYFSTIFQLAHAHMVSSTIKPNNVICAATGEQSVNPTPSATAEASSVLHSKPSVRSVLQERSVIQELLTEKQALEVQILKNRKQIEIYEYRQREQQEALDQANKNLSSLGEVVDMQPQIEELSAIADELEKTLAISKQERAPLIDALRQLSESIVKTTVQHSSLLQEANTLENTLKSFQESQAQLTQQLQHKQTEQETILHNLVDTSRDMESIQQRITDILHQSHEICTKKSTVELALSSLSGAVSDVVGIATNGLVSSCYTLLERVKDRQLESPHQIPVFLREEVIKALAPFQHTDDNL